MWSQTLVCRLRRAPGGAGGRGAGRQQRRRRRRSGGRGPPDAGRGCPPACHGPPCGRRDTRTRPQTDRQAGAGNHCQGFAGGTHQGWSGGAFLVDKLSAPQRATPYSFERGRRPGAGELAPRQARAPPQRRNPAGAQRRGLKKTRRSAAKRLYCAPAPRGAGSDWGASSPARARPNEHDNKAGAAAPASEYSPSPPGVSRAAGEGGAGPAPEGAVTG